MTRKLAVDLAAPSASYTPPATLQVGVAISAMTPSTSATDIASYGATGLPSGLSINSTTGVISGTPDIANPTTATATVTVTDTAGNPTDVPITFPMVAKGDQKLTDFSYTPATVMFGDAAPTLTAPTGAVTTVSYAATPAEVCTVNATSGALTLVGMGDCVVTATAEATANYNDAAAEFTVTVQAVGTLALNLDPIATDDTVNLAEKTAGFTISGDTGSEADVSVTVTVGATELTATSTATAWSVSVPPNATYITGTSVTVTVSATKTGFTPPTDVARKLAVDLTAPTASYTAPGTSGGRGHRRHDAEHHRHRHRLLRRDGPALGAGHRRRHRRHQRHPGHRQPHHRDRHGDGDRQRRQPHRRSDLLPDGGQG